mgnify:CR=1 FL=1
MFQLKAVFKFIAFLIVCVVICIPQIFVLWSKNQKLICFLPRLWHKAVCCIFGIKVSIKGDMPPTDKLILFVSNHLSYLDIPVIGQYLRAYFVAKDDVSDWPFFGFLTRLQKTIFIKRTIRGLKKAGEDIKQHLEDNKSLVVFPEGTSSRGESVLPFKSSLFDALEDNSLKKQVILQPFTVRIIKVNGKTPAKEDPIRDYYAWHGDMALLPHLWEFAKSKGAHIELSFHSPIHPDLSDGRKTLSQAAFRSVEAGLAG